MTNAHDDHACPACGGSGGGPFGRPGSAWDVEDYVCPRCRGLGVVAAEVPSPSADDVRSWRPGIVKAPAPAPAQGEERRRKSGAS